MAVFCGLLSTAGAIPVTAPARVAVSAPSLTGVQVPTGLMLQSDQPIERRISVAARGAIKQVRGYFHTLGWMFSRALDWWGNWIKRGLFSVLVAIVAALADSSLVEALRTDGWRTLISYVPMMLYVYTRLLFSSGVKFAPKLLLLGALVYGVVWRDLIPDRHLVPGRLEDILFIAIATRAFVYACPDELLNQYANHAVQLRRRIRFPAGSR